MIDGVDAPINVIFRNLELILQEPVNDNVKQYAAEIRFAAQSIMGSCQQDDLACTAQENNTPTPESLLGEEMATRLKTGQVCKEDLEQLLDRLVECLREYKIEQAEELFYKLAQCIYSEDEGIENHIHGAEVYMLSYDYQGVIDELLKIRDQL